MPLPPEKQCALREYALQLSSTLSDVQPASVRALSQEVICRLGELACVQHSHLLLLQGDHEPELFGSVIAEWSAVPMPLVLPELQHVPMQLFSRQAVQQLKAGALRFTRSLMTPNTPAVNWYPGCCVNSACMRMK